MHDTELCFQKAKTEKVLKMAISEVVGQFNKNGFPS